VTKRGWVVVRAAIIAFAVVDGAASLWTRRALESSRPHQTQGTFVEPYATLHGTIFISHVDRALQTGLLAAGLVLVIAYLVVVRASTGRPLRSSV
jgi:hypothetical protein